MTDIRRWGKAGVRLTPEQANARNLQNFRLARIAESIARVEADAHRKRAAGMVVPYNITIALDLDGLYGPEVDRACGAAEPDVDRWEEAKLYPRWDQLVALAALTERRVGYFVSAGHGIGVLDTSLRFHLRREEIAGTNRVVPRMRYPDLVVARCAGTDAWKESNGG